MAYKIVIEDLQAWHGSKKILNGINLPIHANMVTAIIGPSGCGKTTLLRCLNRMHEVLPSSRIHGRMLFDGSDIYRELSAIDIRRKIGMVFQAPNIFPNMNIFENVAVGLKLNGERNRKNLGEVVEKSLRQTGLWDEVKDRLRQDASGLSSGQLQRLCIGRALAIEPEVLLLDEPCSSLDPIATIRIEELLKELKQRYTVIIVTHNMQQAARVSDYTAFLTEGELIEYGVTPEMFIRPRDRRTENYITGRWGVNNS
ncbi:MAG: phosphate ABC transporter ATP-binding protein [Firmicutes bacterium]|nr:phosphate ABC transporter ATP-binding protein [Bacillota bacterium]